MSSAKVHMPSSEGTSYSQENLTLAPGATTNSFIVVVLIDEVSSIFIIDLDHQMSPSA